MAVFLKEKISWSVHDTYSLHNKIISDFLRLSRVKQTSHRGAHDAIIYYKNHPRVFLDFKTDSEGIPNPLDTLLNLRNPVRHINYSSLIAGLYGVLASFSRLSENKATNIEISLNQCHALAQILPNAFFYKASLEALPFAFHPLMNIYQTKTSYIYTHLIVTKQFQNFVKAFRLSSYYRLKSIPWHRLLKDPSDLIKPSTKRQLQSFLSDFFISEPASYWHEKAREHDFIVEPINICQPVADLSYALDLIEPPKELSRVGRSHLKILDLSQVLAGPLCSLFLRQMGASVFKIDLHYAKVQRFHRLLEQLLRHDKIPRRRLDLFDELDQKKLIAILKSFQPNIVVHNFRESALEKIKNLSAWSVLEKKPQWAGITSYTDKSIAGFEQSVQASSGLMDQSREKPELLPIAIHDILSGLALAVKIQLNSHDTNNDIEFSLRNSSELIKCALRLHEINHPKSKLKGSWSLSKDHRGLILPKSAVKIDGKALSLL